METRTFLNLSPNECGLAHYPVRKNAERHFRVAKILSNHKEYPNAIAHLILGTEEFIKATVLLMESKGFTMSKMKKYKSLFYNHSARHTIIRDFYSMWMVMSNLFDTKPRKKNENKVLYWLNIIKDVAGDVIESVDNHEWWKTADTRKQNCFYVDYANGLLVPSSFTELQYLEAKKHVERFIYDMRVIIAVLIKANEEQLHILRERFWDYDFPDMVSEVISKK